MYEISVKDLFIEPMIDCNNCMKKLIASECRGNYSSHHNSSAARLLLFKDVWHVQFQLKVLFYQNFNNTRWKKNLKKPNFIKDVKII